jgi:hypothetical protein
VEGHGLILLETDPFSSDSHLELLN